jgi:hypothetical protein
VNDGMVVLETGQTRGGRLEESAEHMGSLRAPMLPAPLQFLVAMLESELFVAAPSAASRSP